MLSNSTIDYIASANVRPITSGYGENAWQRYRYAGDSSAANSGNPDEKPCTGTVSLRVVLGDERMMTDVPYSKLSQENAAGTRTRGRYDALVESFKKYDAKFPADKNGAYEALFEKISQLQFVDNVASYNEWDNSIDIILKLSNGLKVSISQFLDDEDASVVFSIHRGKTLLVADEMPVSELVSTLNAEIVRLG